MLFSGLSLEVGIIAVAWLVYRLILSLEIFSEAM